MAEPALALDALSTALLARARDPVPRSWLRLRLHDTDLGWLSPQRARELAGLLAHSRIEPADGVLAWRPPVSDGRRLSVLLQEAAQTLRVRGSIRGWRDEAYACEAPLADPCAARGAELLRLERAAFRAFGLMSRAVHVNGWLPDGRMLCGRRALAKATDPGRLDNLAAGGLGAGEALLDCARRELLEEAGVEAGLSLGLRACGALRSTRVEPEGLHDEVLHVYALELPEGFEPRNQDGEVSEFLCLDEQALAQRLAAGEFSADAGLVVALGWRDRQARRRAGPAGAAGQVRGGDDGAG